MTDADRLTRLEERLAHLQQHVAAQDKAMLELHEELARLRQELAAARARVQPPSRGEAPSDEPAAGERPPHY